MRITTHPKVKILSIEFFIIITSILFLLYRVMSLIIAPMGLYIDEAYAAAQSLCIANSGRDLNGAFFPLYTEILHPGTSPVPFTYTWPASLWITFFGASIFSLRFFTLIIGIFTIYGTFKFVELLYPKAKYWSLFLALLSPWFFYIFRMAWEPIMYPALTVWAIVFYHSPKIILRILAGVLFALAMCAYSPGIITTPLILVLLLVQKFRNKFSWRLFLPVWLTCAGCFAFFYARPSLTLVPGRFQMLSIFNPDFLTKKYGGDSYFFALQELLLNYVSYLSPQFLFLEGDTNLRMSPPFIGQLSWVEMLGVLTFLTLAANVIIKRRFYSKQYNMINLAVICISGIFIAILPAALTQTTSPHSQRSVLALFFFNILGAIGLFNLAKYYLGRVSIIILTASYILLFSWSTFIKYPLVAQSDFDTHYYESAQKLSADQFIVKWPLHHKKAAIYYLQQYYGLSCNQAKTFL